MILNPRVEGPRDQGLCRRATNDIKIEEVPNHLPFILIWITLSHLSFRVRMQAESSGLSIQLSVFTQILISK